MIGKVIKGMSYAKCIAYCLDDRKELSEEQKMEISILEGVQHKDRAEVLEYNLCFGNKRELARQFLDVRKLRPDVEKPLFHITLRPAPGDQLSKQQFIEISQAAALEFGLDKNQYICVLHKDTAQPHIHIVGNRIGLDGKLASDSQSYRRMAELCRRIEKKYGLKQVANPRRFQSQQERQAPRQDQRKLDLKKAIQQALKDSINYPQFEQKMKAQGYQVIKGRGISFVDAKKVSTKGSEVKFSLRTIELILEANRLDQPLNLERLTAEQREKAAAEWTRDFKALRQEYYQVKGIDPNGGHTPSETLGLQKMLDILFNPDREDMTIPWELSQDVQKKRKRSKHR